MVGLILVLLLCTVLAGGVIGYVAWQARLDGRQVLTESGEEALSGLRRRAATAGERRRRPGRAETPHGGTETEGTAVREDHDVEPRQPAEPTETAETAESTTTAETASAATVDGAAEPGDETARRRVDSSAA